MATYGTYMEHTHGIGLGPLTGGKGGLAHKLPRCKVKPEGPSKETFAISLSLSYFSKVGTLSLSYMEHKWPSLTQKVALPFPGAFKAH